MRMTVNPEDFIITRKRKKYKFALFANSPLCFEFEEWDGAWQADVIEIGAGTGQFVVELAARYPRRRYVAVDVKADRLQKGAHEAERRGLENVRFLRARADQLVDIFKPNSLMEVWLTFSDPFPRTRSAGRRLTHSTFLSGYEKMLTMSGTLKIKHDNPEFFQWTLEQLVANQWHISELSFNLHESALSNDYKVLTPYEQRWLGEGRITQFVAAVKVGGIKSVDKKGIIELAGWYGAIAILSAYALVSFVVIAPQGIIYQLLNLTGALGVIIISIYKNVKQSVVLNIFWAGVALVALLQIIM